jgi:SAM-dependent methyltransferase
MDTSERLERNIAGTSHVRSEEASSLLLSRHLFAYHCAFRFLPDDARVLEIGPGDGYGTELLQSRYDVYTVDISEPALRAVPDSVPAIRADGTRLPFAPDTFDGIVGFQILEHFPDPPALLREIKSVVRPNGVGLLTTPNRKHRLVSGQTPWNPHHMIEYSTEALRALFDGSDCVYEVFGVDAAPEVRERELNRVPGTIKNLALKHGVGPLIRFADWLDSATGANDSDDTPVFPEQFFLTRRDVDDSIDFFVVLQA